MIAIFYYLIKKDFFKMKSLKDVLIEANINDLITFLNDNNELDMEIVLLLQCNNYIHSVEQPYSMESVIKIA